MKIGAIGFYTNFNHNNIENIKYSSEQTILEYDMLIINVNNIYDMNVRYKNNINSDYNYDANYYNNFNDLNINRGMRSGIKNDFEFNQDDNMYMGYKPRNYF